MKENNQPLFETLIACDPIVGLPQVPSEDFRPDRADLISEMDRLGIERAVVRHRAALTCGPVPGNRMVLEEVRNSDRLLATWFLTPDGFEPDFDPAKTVDLMIRSGIRIGWTDPKSESFSPLPWCAGPLYEVLQDRKVPLLLDYNAVTLDDLDVILTSFPGLRVILLGVPRHGRNRMVYPLLRRHADLRLCLSHTYSAHCGIEDLCRTFGHDRWVFGSGYPDAEGGAAISGLSYADISDDAGEAIAHGTIERLLAEVK